MSSFLKITNLSRRALDLSEKQSLVYAILAKEGFLNPSRIARLTDLKRTTVYVEIDGLKRKGLIHEKIVGKRKLFSITKQAALKEFLQEEQDKLLKKKLSIDELVLFMESFEKNIKQETTVEILEGKYGIVTLLEKILKEKQNVYWFGSINAMLEMISEDKLYKLFSWKRMDQNTTSFAITDEEILKYKKFREQIGGFRQFRLVNKPLSSNTIFFIFGETVGFARIQEKKIKIILIKDKAIHETAQMMYSFMWDALPSI